MQIDLQGPDANISDRLEAPRSATSTPIFQAFIDYRQGQREKQTWGNCDLEMLSFDISKTGYDLNLDIIDDPDGECMLMLFVRSDLYTAAEAGTIVTCYEKIVNFFASRPKSSLLAPQIFESHQVKRSAEFSRGLFAYLCSIFSGDVADAYPPEQAMLVIPNGSIP